MKITVRQIFIFCLLIAAPLPWMINIGSMAGFYLYEGVTIICFLLIIGKKLFYKAKNQLRDANSIRSITNYGVLFISLALMGLSINVIENLFEGKIDIDIQLKMMAHVIISILVLLGAFLSGFTLFNGMHDLRRVTKILFIAFLLLSVQTLIVWIDSTGGVIARYNYEPPTGLGQGDTAKMLIVGFFFGLLMLSYNRGIIKKSLIVISLVVFGITIMSIQSRSAYFSFFLQLLVYGFLVNKINNKKSQISVFLKILSVGFFLYLISDNVLNPQFVTSVGEDLINSESAESLNKFIVIQDGINMFLNNPFFGVGWGQFGVHTKAEMYVSGIGYTVSSPHNGIIQLMSETGMLGALSAIMLCFVIIKNIYYQYKIYINSPIKLFFCVILILVSTVMVTQIIQSSYLFPAPTQRSSIRLPFYYWFLVGYALSFMKRNYDIKCLAKT
ncbi:MAG: O-antigen ligase family protein [Flavobacteriales bacterium]|jgi:O-antigen ligase|nr:O-antigen ligase family protein [Flavobacteriales bacterium]